ncbi:MAG TPA: hypothetical protein DHV26_08845, partial [Cytophagales bacterium]|nr:hypothetical protein [Cytophagales bacterium]
MSDQQKLDELLQKLQAAEMRQQQLTFDLKELRKQLQAVQSKEQPETEPVEPTIPTVVAEPVVLPTTPTPKPAKPKEKNAWEYFIGTNLLNKIGIAV